IEPARCHLLPDRNPERHIRHEADSWLGELAGSMAVLGRLERRIPHWAIPAACHSKEATAQLGPVSTNGPRHFDYVGSRREAVPKSKIQWWPLGPGGVEQL